MMQVLGALISTSQNGFMGGRQILDSILIANKRLDNRLKSSILGVICKQDLEKTYDHVNWEILSYLMGHLGFGSKWRNWIFACISTAQFSLS